MALIREDGVHHVNGVTRWEEIDEVILWYDVDSPYENLSIEIKAGDYHEVITPPAFRAKAMVDLVHRMLPDERVVLKDRIADDPDRYGGGGPAIFILLSNLPHLWRRWRLGRHLVWDDYRELIRISLYALLLLLVGVLVLWEYLGSRY